ncbi:MAG: type II toxin-antitoxin system RelE/ParE family toxin [Desertifilum sp.]|nr:type II toxin-antitoxin system RelE/ParE family toxin [Desertifilum sp.]
MIILLLEVWKLAKTLRVDFKKKCQHLTQFPNLGRSYTELKPNLRGVPLMGYIIFYQVVDGGVEIVRVLSAYRDLKSLFH